ncbi:response regulator [Janthinobacterium agaricidamnosum]|uniref:Response regulator n=1 Tax=Janthinobacterium agaricidamnosum NBRC 102515 = DSM 9628 TaxID=1349767 RepID=W0V5Y8_9BURK|nr:response regulator [Janthinobacterium agaricidamnosum]CDG82682.1 response regulator [Janthinobacterium agaricidamnosum NBRC 102515 = DSM 9628]
MAQRLDPQRILIVDDNRDAADIIVEFLVMYGHDAKSAYDGEDALRVAASFVPDVVFLDIGMPGINGYQVAASMRATPRFDKTRVVALTAWSDDEARRRVAAAGFHLHLIKPASFDTILGALNMFNVLEQADALF